MGRIGLDAADLRILAAVQRYGPLSKAKLAERVNLSPTPCWTRLARLRKAGLIRGYRADIALDRFGDISRVVVTVALDRHRSADFDRFERHIAGRDEIVDCIATGGGMDYVMKVITPTLGAFQAVMEDMLAADLGIARYMTYIVTREVKSVPPNLAALAKGGDRPG